MEWSSLKKLQKKRGRRKRFPVEKLQTIAWFYCLTNLLGVNVIGETIDSICGDVESKLVDDLGYSFGAGADSLESSCRDWIQGRYTPKVETLKQISDLVESIKVGDGLKLWLTFFVGIEGHPLWCKFDFYSQDVIYNIPRDFLSGSLKSLGDLGIITDNFISLHTRGMGVFSGNVSNKEAFTEAVNNGLSMNAHLAKSILERYGITNSLYVDVCLEQVMYLIEFDPIKYVPSEYLKENIF